jgi:hypothetical protein
MCHGPTRKGIWSLRAEYNLRDIDDMSMPPVVKERHGRARTSVRKPAVLGALISYAGDAPVPWRTVVMLCRSRRTPFSRASTTIEGESAYSWRGV